MGIKSMKKRQPTYDVSCYDLASDFLESEPFWNDANCHELATEIQRCIEGFIEHKRDNYEPPDPPGFEAGFADNH
jgi:hypothetical protein